MDYRRGSGINFYRGYQALVSQEKNRQSKKLAVSVLPLALVGIVLLGIWGYLAANNRERQRELDGIRTQIEGLRPGYEAAGQLQNRRDSARNVYETLAAGRFVFSIFPPLTQDLFDSVRDCAGNIFHITAYSYNETDRVLTVNAWADSVNEVPKFVERLRETDRFESVRYTGYTSDSEERYYCTVGCTLGFPTSAEGQAAE